MNIIPLHDVTDSDKVERLAADMRVNGWVGNPVLIDDDESNEPRALTGSHRIVAATLAGIDVEYYSLANSKIDIGALFFECCDDDDMLSVIKEGDDEYAVSIMLKEISNNGAGE